MKYNLLELTQAVLSSMDSDEITSITDTPESMQVVEVIKTVYDDILTRGDIAVNKQVFNLQVTTDPAKPVLMTKPASIETVEWIKYDTQLDGATSSVWSNMTYLPPMDFIDFMHSYNEDESNVITFNHVVEGHTLKFTVRNDTAPQYYTSFDDSTIFFDAYDSNVEAALQAVKTLCYGTKVTDFNKTDEYVPNLQPQQFALLLNEAKSLAWAELKQVEHGKAEQTARRNWKHLQKHRREIPNATGFMYNRAHTSSTHLPNFARNR